jgi:hypothetical protein
VDRAWPFPVFYEGDAETFYHHALSLLAGQSYDAGVPFHPPLFPLLLAALHGLLGNPAPNLALRIVLAAIHSLQVPLLWLLLRRFVPPGAALAGALLAAWSFGLSLVSICAVSEGLYLLLLLAALLCFVRLREGGGRTDDARGGGPRGPAGGVVPALFGGLLGLLALTRAEGLGVAAALLVWGAAGALRALAREARPARKAAAFRAIRPWAIALLALGVTLAPWTIRNAVTLERANRASPPELPPLPTLVLATAYGPLNFALANHAGAPGHFTRSLLTSGLTRGVLDLRDPQHRDVFVHGYRRGWQFIREEPAAYLRLAGRKLALLARALRLGWFQWDLPGGLAGTRYPVDLVTPDSPAAIPAHLVLLLPGIWMLAAGRAGVERARGRDWLRLCAVLLGLTLLATLAFFGYARQGALLLPFLCGIEGVALAAAASRVGSRLPAFARRRPARSVIALVVVLWLVELAGAFQDRDFIASGETEAGGRMLNRDSVLTLRPKGSPSLTP